MPGNIPPIESLRPGGMPRDDYYRPQPTPEQLDEELRNQVWDLQAAHGLDEDGTPAVGAFDSRHPFHPRSALTLPLPVCGACGREFARLEYLAEHRPGCAGEPAEPEPDPDAPQETVPVSRCVVCGGPANPSAIHCSVRCRSKDQLRRMKAAADGKLG